VLIRPAVAGDRDALYDICLRTGDAGADATALYRDRELIGSIWAGPYLALEPDLSFVAVGEDGVTGYVLGAADTAAFEAACEQRWWPDLRKRWPEPPAADTTSADGRLIERIHHPPATPASLLVEFPAHLHINLLPSGQGRGAGGRLVETLFAALRARDVAGVHLGVGRRNERAIGFYEHLGFRAIADVADAPDSLVMGMRVR
jgi:ribosomal protein S18 acetylase RimI-like enzyme